MKLSKTGERFLLSWEGLKLKAYQCSAGVWTIAVGNTTYLDGRRVQKGDTLTRTQAMTLFHSMLPNYEAMVLRNVKVPLKQQEFDALVSFFWNFGEGQLKKSGTIAALNAGDRARFLRGHLQWCNVNGQISPGVLRRRHAEQDLFLENKLTLA